MTAAKEGGGAGKSPIGSAPRPEDLDLEGLEAVPPETMRELLAIKAEEWAKELASQAEFFKTLAPYLPQELLEQHEELARRFGR